MYSRSTVAPAIARFSPSAAGFSVWWSLATATRSIGGNHLIHSLRRNVNLKILLNNQIYGLTMGNFTDRSAR
jgi:2-oxoglutarate ferredoxin oxidoreductase subunit beta